MKEKKILPLVLSMSLPMVISMAIHSLYNYEPAEPLSIADSTSQNIMSF